LDTCLDAGEAKLAKVFYMQISEFDANDRIHIDRDAPRYLSCPLVRYRIQRRSNASGRSFEFVTAYVIVFGHEAFGGARGVALKFNPEHAGGRNRRDILAARNANEFSDPAVLPYLQIIQIAVLARFDIELGEREGDLVTGGGIQDPDALRV